MATIGAAGPKVQGAITLASSQGDWTDAHTLPTTADSLGTLAAPLTAGDNVRAIAVSAAASRIYLRCSYDSARTVTTSPVVRVFAVYGAFANGSFVTGAKVVRLDALDGGATGLTLTCGANDLTEGTRKVSRLTAIEPVTLIRGDPMGATHILVMVQTAAVMDSGTDIRIEALVL